MRFYTHTHTHYCGIDLHARSIYLCILDGEGEILLHRNFKATPEAFLKAVARYRDDLVVAVECIFTWYWLADLCAEEGIAFVLGHALYMRAIHGGKAKNDRIDARKIALLLRGGLLPQAYVYPKAMRATRDLLRRRNHLMHKRADLLAHIQNTASQYNLPPPECYRLLTGGGLISVRRPQTATSYREYAPLSGLYLSTCAHREVCCPSSSASPMRIPSGPRM